MRGGPQRLAKSLKPARTQLIETARPSLEARVREVTTIKVTSRHHDMNTVTGEEVIFTLGNSPRLRPTKKQ